MLLEPIFNNYTVQCIAKYGNYTVQCIAVYDNMTVQCIALYNTVQCIALYNRVLYMQSHNQNHAASFVLAYHMAKSLDPMCNIFCDICM